MGDKNGNVRRSSWLVVNRCLRIIHRLMQAPANSEELLKIVYDDAHIINESLSDSATRKRFEKDRARLREWLGIELEYSRTLDEYVLINIGQPLIDLPDGAIKGLAFLQQNFSDNDAPMREEIHTLMRTIIMAMPFPRRRQLERQRGILEIELGAKDEDNIREDVWEAVKVSVSERRELEFDYISLTNPDGLPRRHRVEPIRYFFDTVRKHYYLEFFWVESRSHLKTIAWNHKVQRFRLGRMDNPQVLPKHFIPNRRIPQKELVYELSPLVARLGVTRHFSDMQIIYNEDGSVRVHVMSSNLFFDLRQLLHYGNNCKVIAGEDAVKEMKEIVRNLYNQYFLSTETPLE